MVSFTDHSPLGNQASSKEYTKNQSTSHNTALVYHPTTSQEKHKTHFYIETYQVIMLYSYTKAKPKKYAMHLEAIDVVKYTTEQAKLKLGQ